MGEGAVVLYVCRHTQRYDMTEDIVLESMLMMYKVFGKLEKVGEGRVKWRIDG